jgi:Fur family ferric uptake transcriptional regulator
LFGDFSSATVAHFGGLSCNLIANRASRPHDKIFHMTPTELPPAIELQAETLIRDTGARLTRPRTRALAFLLTQPAPLTHHQIHQQLPGEALDAVTLYRVLEWLTENALAHRILGADQVWRFSAKGQAGHASHDHAHFQCTSCDSVTCFTDVPVPRRLKMPAGFTNHEVDFLIKGICPLCGKQ